jgi:lipoprotein Spr
MISISYSCRAPKGLSADVKKDTSITEIDSTIILIDTLTTPSIDTLQQEMASILNVSFEQIKDLKLYRFIKDNLGKKCNAVSENNFTCESFLSALIKNVYNRDFPNTIVEQMKYKKVELFKNDKFLEQGDILFFKTTNKKKGEITHSGLYLQNGYFVVATYNEGVVIAKFQNGYWNKRFVSAGRYTRFTDKKN